MRGSPEQIPGSSWSRKIPLLYPPHATAPLVLLPRFLPQEIFRLEKLVAGGFQTEPLRQSKTKGQRG